MIGFICIIENKNGIIVELKLNSVEKESVFLNIEKKKFLHFSDDACVEKSFNHFCVSDSLSVLFFTFRKKGILLLSWSIEIGENIHCGFYVTFVSVCASYRMDLVYSLYIQ